MAALDPLSIAVRLVEDEKNSVSALITKLNKELSNSKLTLGISPDATKNAEKFLKTLGEIQTTLSGISNGMKNATWGNLSADTNILISKFKELSNVASSIGASMANAFPSGIMKELAQLEKAANTLKEIRGASRSGDGSGGVVNSAESIKRAMHESEKLYQFMLKLQNMENTMSGHGVKTDMFSGWISQLMKVRNELELIKKSADGTHPTSGLTTSEFLKANGVSSLYSNAKLDLKPYEDLEKEFERLIKLQKELEKGLTGLSDANPLKAQVQNAIRDLDMLRQYMATQSIWDLGKNIASNNTQVKAYAELLANANQQEKEIAGNAKRAEVAQQQFQRSSNDAAKEIDKIDRKLTEISKVITDAKKYNIDTTSLEKAYQDLLAIRNLYTQVQAGSTSLSSVKGGSAEAIANRDAKEAISQTTKAIKEEEAALKRNASAKESAARRANQLSIEEQKLAQAMQRATNQGGLQAYMLNDLKSMAQQYLSVWAASSFIQSMAQITGELELQQKSLEVIIGSATYASQLFGEIRDLSQQSPYTFQDLLKSTRQLAAFGIQTKDLYGTMKALSDIGAGLSVDVQRLILAYGHVKSYGYLSGIQNRQFETAGIDLVGALTDRYNKLADAEERAGRAAEHVTRKDVFKKISKKEVDFEDVNAVIMELDQPGGRFYNMQERQFETLGGKLRNLRNNYNIMMAEMGKANHSMLMSGVEMLNELTGHWDRYARIIKSILIPLGAFKLAMYAVNGAIGAQTNAMSKNVMALVRNQRATQAAIAAMQVPIRTGVRNGFGLGSLVGAARGGWNASGTFSPRLSDAKSFYRTVQQGFSNGQLSKSQLMMMGVNKDLPKLYRQIALSIAGVDKAQRTAIASSSGWTRALLKLRLQTSLAASALRTFAASIASMALQMAPMAIIGGIVAVFSHFKSMAEDTKKTLEDLSEHANEDAKSISSVIEGYSERGVTQSGTVSYLNGHEILSAGLSFDEKKIQEMTASDVEDLKLELQKYSPLYDGDLVDIGKFESQADQIMAILNKLDSYRHSQELLAADATIYEDAAGASFWGGYESFIENLEEFGKAVDRAGKTVASFSDEELNNFDKELGGALSRAKESGAATSEAEALRQYLVRIMFLSDADRKAITKSWSDNLKMAYYEASKTQYYTNKKGKLRGTSGFWGFLNTYGIQGHNTALWNKNASSHIDSYKNSVSRLSETMRGRINKEFGPEEIDGALNYAIKQYEAFASEVKGLSEEAKEAGLQMLLSGVFGKGSNLEGAYNTYLNKQFQGEVFNQIEREKKVNVFMSPEEIKNNVDTVIQDTLKRWKDGGKGVEKITKDTINNIVSSILNANTVVTEWQNTLLGKNQTGEKKSFWEGFASFNSKEIIDSKSEADFWDAIRKKYKDIKSKLNREKKVLDVKFGIKLTPEIFMDSSKIKEAMKKINPNNQFYRDENGKWQVSHKNTGNLYNEYSERYLPLMNLLQEAYSDLKGAEERNVDLNDDKNKNKGNGQYRDTEYDLWERRIKLIKEARKEYEYWEKQIHSEEEAVRKVKEIFANLVGKGKVLPEGALDEINKYKETIKQLRDEFWAVRYAKDKAMKPGKIRDIRIKNDEKMIQEADSLLNEIDKMEFEKATEEFVSNMNKALEDLTRRWDIFNSIRERIGNDEVSARMAGLTPLDRSSNVVFKADAMKAEIERVISESVSGIGAIDFSKVIGMDAKELENYVGGLFAVVTQGLSKDDEKLKAYQRRIKEIVEALKKWQQAELDTQTKAQEAYAAVMDKAMDYASQVARINAELERQIELIEKSNNLSEREKSDAIGRLRANSEMEKERASGRFGRFFNDAFSESRKEMNEYADLLRSKLNAQFKTGAISANQYAEELDKIDEKMSEFNSDRIEETLGKVFGEGLADILQRKLREGAEKRQEGLDMQERGRSMISQSDELWRNSFSAMANGDTAGAQAMQNQAMSLFSEGNSLQQMGSQMAQMGEGMMSGAESGMEAIKIIDMIVHGINDAVQEMKAIKDDLYETIGSFGNDLDSNAALGFGAFMDGFAAASEGATKAWDSLKSGNPMGVVQGVVQSFTGWIKAFNAFHDKKREVQIQKLGEQITHIENTLETIRSLREKELGYSSGNNIRGLASMYKGLLNEQTIAIRAALDRGGFENLAEASRIKKGSAVNRGMKEYYSRALDNNAMTSYAMEYNLLLDKRKKKMQQYNEEADKKDKDKSKLEDYKKEIAELDVEVQQFAENLLNDLWGIDFKGWAGQISDALMTAFENGENAADAFHETMNDIMADVVKQMMNLAIVEPFMDMLKKDIIGFTDENGVYHRGVIDTQNPTEFLNDPSGKVGEILSAVGNWYENVAGPLTTATTEYMEGANDLLKQYGIDLTANSKKNNNSNSNSITQSITEETAGYMTGILAAMHQDGSVRRLMLGTLVSEQMPSVIEMMTVSGNHIAGIDENTRAIMHMMQDGSGQMYERIYYIGEKLDRFANGFDKVTVS